MALGSCFVFFVDFSRDQWRFMTSLTGTEIRDNSVDETFYPRPYKCAVLPHLAQPSFATPPLLISAATEASNLKFVIQLVFGSSMPKQLFGPKLTGSGLGEHPKNFGAPFLFLQQLKL